MCKSGGAMFKRMGNGAMIRCSTFDVKPQYNRFVCLFFHFKQVTRIGKYPGNIVFFC